MRSIATTPPAIALLPQAPVTASPVPWLTSLYHKSWRGDYGSARYPGNCSGELIRRAAEQIDGLGLAEAAGRLWEAHGYARSSARNVEELMPTVGVSPSGTEAEIAGGPRSPAEADSRMNALVEACRTCLEDAEGALSGEWDRGDEGFRAQVRLLRNVLRDHGNRP